MGERGGPYIPRQERALLISYDSGAIIENGNKNKYDFLSNTAKPSPAIIPSLTRVRAFVFEQKIISIISSPLPF